METNSYFILITKTGGIYDFDKRCNKLDMHFKDTCISFEEFNEETDEYVILGIAPIESIDCIRNINAESVFQEEA